MNNVAFQSKIDEINNQLAALKNEPSKPVVPQVSRYVDKPTRLNRDEKQLAKKAKELPKMFGQKNLPDTIKFLKKITGTRLRAEITDEMRASIIRDMAAGRKPRWISEHYGIAIATANLIRMKAGLNKRRSLATV